MSRKLVVAIAGAGIGREHLTAYLANPQLFEVGCICDPDKQRAEPLVAQANCDYSDNYVDVLQRSDIDVLDVCLPPAMHKQAIVEAVDAGKHVICEKPLVSSLAELDEIEAHVAGQNSLIIPIFQYRFGNGIGQLCSLIDAGLAGEPLVATLETHWNRDDAYYAVPWRGRWDTEQGGAIVSHAIHAHDLLCCVLGPVATVQAVLATRVNQIEVEDCAGVIFTMGCGAIATSSVSLGSANDQSRLRFCFSNLTAESTRSAYNPGTGGWSFTARPASRQATIDRALAQYKQHREGFERQFQLAHSAMIGQADAPVSLQDARASLEMISAIYQSSRLQRAVKLPVTNKSSVYAGWQP